MGKETGFATVHALMKKRNIAQAAIVEGNPALGLAGQTDDKIDLVR